MTKASDNPYPSILITEGTEPTAPAAGKQRLYIDSTTHKLKRTDSSGTDVTIESAGGSVASDVIWDAAGDLAVGSGADTAAKLTKGAAGGALSIINAAVAWNSGTSFPGSAVTGDRYWRTDVNGGMEYVYDGTRWVSSTIFHDIGHNDFTGAATANSTAGRWAFPGGTYTDIWMIGVEILAYHSSTTPATIYWSFDALKGTAPEVETSLGTSNTQNNTTLNWTPENITVGALLGAVNHIRVSCTKTSTPGNLNIEVAYRYRLVQT